MKLARFVLAFALLSASVAAHADTLAMTTSGTATLGGSYYAGQAFTVLGSGAYSSIAFNFYTPTLTPYATGTGFLFSTLYTGTPGGLNSSDPGYLGMASASGGFYSFGSSVTLNAGAQYFLYENAVIPAGSISGNSTYPGSFFFSSASTSPYTASTAANFDVTGTRLTPTTATPEPSSVALLGTGLLALTGSLRKRFTR